MQGILYAVPESQTQTSCEQGTAVCLQIHGRLAEDASVSECSVGPGGLSASSKTGNYRRPLGRDSPQDSNYDVQIVSEPIGILVRPGEPWSYDIPSMPDGDAFEARLQKRHDGKVIAPFDLPIIIYDQHRNHVMDPEIISRVVLEGGTLPNGWQWPERTASQRFALKPADETSRSLRHNQQRGKRKAGEDIELCGHTCTVTLLANPGRSNFRGKLDSMSVTDWGFKVLYQKSELQAIRVREVPIEVVSGPPQRIMDVSLNGQPAYSDPPSGRESSQPIRLRLAAVDIQVSFRAPSCADCPG